MLGSLALLSAALARSPADDDPQARGVQALEHADYTQAEQIFSSLAARDPKDYFALFNLAFAESALHKDGEATDHLKQVLVLKPGLYEADLNLGMLYLRDHAAAQAIPVLREAAQSKTDAPRPQRYLGQALLETGDAAGAAAAFGRAVQLDPKDPIAQLGLAQALVRTNQLDEAAPHYRSAAELDGKLNTYLLELASAYEAANRPNDAIPLLQQFPDQPGAHEELGRLYLKAGKPAEAAAEFELAVKAAPTLANKLAWATALLQANRPAEAEPLLAEALRSNPNDFDVLLAIGKIEMGKRSFTVAANTFVAAAKVKPDSTEAWSNAASSFMLAEQYPPALAALDRIRALGAEKPADVYWRAVALDKLHQVKPALASYQQFLAASHGQFPDQEFLARHRSIALAKEANR